jgi:ABC-type polar amino acid transport system ATPase subunit
MIELGVNIDHVATLREARRTYEPDPVWAAVEAHLGGAGGITVHLREDRRHIRDEDVRRLRELVHIKLNLEMAATEEMVGIACALKPEMAMLVPEGRQVFPELSVLDNILLGAHTRREVDRERELAALLHRFPRLRERLTSRAGLLSGGEQQMLAIARGLMAKPRILLLDEPSLGLAPSMIKELFDALAELRDAGVTILLVDQMAALALTVADRGYVLESGHIVRHDTADALVRDPALEAAYLGCAEAAP